jgi:hypothetical protein
MANYKKRGGSIFRDLKDAFIDPPGYATAMANTGNTPIGGKQQPPAQGLSDPIKPTDKQRAVPGESMADTPPIPSNANGINLQKKQKKAQQIEDEN